MRSPYVGLIARRSGENDALTNGASERNSGQSSVESIVKNTSSGVRVVAVLQAVDGGFDPNCAMVQ